jgi:uncharacterized membrane protein
MQTIEYRAARAQSGVWAEGIYPRAATLGLVTGLRASVGMTVLGLSAQRGAAEVPTGRPGGVWRLLRARTALPLLALIAAGEIYADKQPWVPDRTSLLPLGGRVVLGALVGASVGALSGQRAQPRLVGALLGAAGAALGAFAGTRSRKWLARRTSVPDRIWGAAEDGLTLLLGLAAMPR